MELINVMQEMEPQRFNAPVIEKDYRTMNAVIAPLYGPDGKEVDSNIARAVMWDETQEVIGTCGTSFRPVQHREIVDPIIHHFEKQGYTVEEREPNQTDLYDLKGRKGVFITPRFDRSTNGAVMRTDIISGDFCDVTGSSHYLKQGPDTMLFKVSALNSHNGTLALRSNTSMERILCMNGCTTPQFSAGVYARHTTGVNIKAMQTKIQNALDAMSTDAEKFELWAKTRVTIEQAQEMLKRTITKLPNKPNGESHFSDNLLNKILDQFRREDQTVWGLYNAVTHWQTHGQRREGSNVISTTIQRETKVASMLRSKAWGELVN